MQSKGIKINFAKRKEILQNYLTNCKDYDIISPSTLQYAKLKRNTNEIFTICKGKVRMMSETINWIIGSIAISIIVSDIRCRIQLKIIDKLITGTISDVRKTVGECIEIIKNGNRD